MPDRAAAELQDYVFAQQVQQLVHLAGVNAARGDRHHGRERGPGLIEKDAVRRVERDEVLAQRVVVAFGRVRVALKLADDGAGVHVVDAD